MDGAPARRLTMSNTISPRTASRAAYAAAALNLAAALAMLLILREGLPVTGSVSAGRAAYVGGHTVIWRIGWLFWHGADFGLLAFYLALASRWRRRGPIRCDLALVAATAGFAADVAAQTLYMGLGPAASAASFGTMEAVAGLLTGYMANGLYTVAGILLVWAGASELPRSLLLLSLPAWLAGIALSVASLVGSTTGQLWSTAALMPLFVVWTGWMGRWLGARAS